MMELTDIIEFVGKEIARWSPEELEDLKEAVHSADQGLSTGANYFLKGDRRSRIPWQNEREIFSKATRSFERIASAWKKLKR